MMKILACLALLFAVFVATQGFGRQGSDRGHGGHDWGHGDSHSGEGNPWTDTLCNSTALASSFLTQVQQLISTLQSNGSFGQFLSAQAQSITYITNANNATIASNCTGFFSGLKAAKQADQAAAQVQAQYSQTAAQAIGQIIRSLVGGNNYQNNYN